MKGTSPTRKRVTRTASSAKIEFRIFNLITRGEVVEQITTVGIDLAKNVFSLHAVDRSGVVVLRKTVRRDQLVVTKLLPRRGYYRTLVAIANKNARIAWALLAKNETLRLA